MESEAGLWATEFMCSFALEGLSSLIQTIKLISVAGITISSPDIGMGHLVRTTQLLTSLDPRYFKFKIFGQIESIPSWLDNFDYEIIQNLFSNLSSLSFLELLELRGNYKKTLRQQLGSDTTRNAGSGVPLLNNNMIQEGYKAAPNERQVTGLRTYDSNLKTDVNAQIVGLQDDVRSTIKQTTIDSANNGYLGNNVDATTQRQYDSVRVTKKQTTIDSANNGFLSNNIGAMTTKPYESPDWTTKDTTHFSHTGGAGGSTLGNMDQINYMNAETNPTKEIIAQGRAPTLNNTKIANGMDTINMDIKKLDVDYMNHRLNGVDKVYGEIPQDNTCEITTMKDRLEDSSIANRIDPKILNAPKNNFISEESSEYHKNNISNYPEHQKIMNRWVSISAQRHLEFENIVEALDSHKLDLNDLSPSKSLTSENSSSDIVDQINKLNNLYKNGTLTKEEFEKAKSKILN